MADTRYTIPLFALGIILRYYSSTLALSGFLYSFILLTLGFSLCFCRHFFYRTILIGSLATSLGLSYVDWRIKYAEHHSPILPSGQQLIKGHIIDLPHYHTTYVRFHFAVEHPSTTLLIHAKKDKQLLRFLPGQYWELQVYLPPPQHYHNPGEILFSASKPLLAYLQSAHLIRPTTPNAFIHQIRAKLQQKITRSLGETPYAAIISALTIGDQNQISDAQWKRFRETGIVHLISISGLHVTMVAGLIALISRHLFYRIPFLLRRWPVHKPALFLGFIAALLYALIAGFSVPTQRTVFMLFATVCALLSSKNLSPIQIWLTALLAVLLLDPMAVSAIGFWLSFMCVGALILSSSHRLKNPTSWRLWIKSQWIASLASLPILAVIFQSFPLLSPLANTIAIPLVSIFVTPLSLFGLIDPTGYLLHIAEYALRYQDQFLDYLLRLPHTYHFKAPPTWTILPASFSVLLLLLPKGLPLRCWAFVGFLPLFLLSRTQIELGQWQAVAIDVGQGLAVLVQTKHHQLLFDTGTKKSARPALMTVINHYGVKKLDTLILSHNDNDHTGGAPLLMQEIPVQTLLSSLPDTHPLHALAKRTLSCLTPNTWEWDGVSFTLMPTTLQHHAKEDNEKSCVLKINNARLSMLIPGDIGFHEESALIEAYQNSLDVDIVLAPHHGSKYASSKAFIEATTPTWVIFSAGAMNPYQHPHPDTIGRYQGYGSHILRTDKHGAILIDSAKTDPVTTFIQTKS